eukprot:614354-Hanusia_phi.AAC.1
MHCQARPQADGLQAWYKPEVLFKLGSDSLSDCRFKFRQPGSEARKPGPLGVCARILIFSRMPQFSLRSCLPELSVAAGGGRRTEYGQSIDKVAKLCLPKSVMKTR